MRKALVFVLLAISTVLLPIPSIKKSALTGRRPAFVDADKRKLPKAVEPEGGVGVGVGVGVLPELADIKNI